MTSKSDLRKRMLSERDAMDPAVRAGYSLEIARLLEQIYESAGIESIFCYISVGSEPDTRRLIDSALAGGKRVCAPKCESLGFMNAHEIAGAHDLAPGRYGIPEPKAHCLPVSPEDIDLIIVPCVCCDMDGYRLGYGGGFYDRWLSGRRARAAALCFENILVPQVPREPHDQPVDFVVTNATLHVV